MRTGLEDRAALARADRPRPLPRHARRPAADRPARQGRPARVRRELREGRGPGLVLLAPHRRRARPGHRAAAGRRLLLAQRLPHLADLRRPQLAGALHPAVGGPGRRPAALRPARRERPPHAHPGVQARRVAGGRRHAGEPPGVAGGLELLPLRQDLRPPQPRLPRPGLRPAADARPVHPAGPAAPRARQAPPAAAVRRGRPHLEPRAVDAHPPAHPLGRRRRRLDLRPHPGGGVHAGRALRRRRAGPRRLRAFDRVLAAHALLVRAALRRRQPRARRPGRPSARDARHRPGRQPRRADLGHRPRPEGDGPDRRMGLAGRHAAEPAGAGLADGRVPRPLPHRVRLVAAP